MFLLFQSVDQPRPVCITFGCVWGLFIIIVDRYILASYRKADRGEGMQLLPRFFLALIISITITGPLEIKVFGKDVEVEANAIKRQQIDTLKAANVKRENDLTTESQQTETQLQHTLDQISENSRTIIVPNGRMVTDSTGAGHTVASVIRPRYTVMDAQKQRLQAKLKSLRGRTDTAEQEVKNVDTTAVARKIMSASGLLLNLRALHKVWTKDLLSFIMGIFFFLLIFAFEVLPVLSKFISKATAYDNEIKSIEERIEGYNRWIASEEQRERDSFTELATSGHRHHVEMTGMRHKTFADIQDEADRSFLEHEKIVLEKLGEERERIQGELNQKMLQAIADAQRRLGTSAIEQWEKLKMDELPGNLDKFINDGRS